LGGGGGRGKRNKKTFAEMEKIARKLGLKINKKKTKNGERKKSLKKNKIGHLKSKKIQI